MNRIYTIAVCMLVAWCTAAVEVRLPDNAGATEKRAAMELKEYIGKMGAAADSAVFTLTVKPDLKPEQWRISSAGDGKIQLDGGSPRGLLYAVYHYLEDVCGVHWWNPREESVPKLSKLPARPLELGGMPAFEIRSIFSLYARDEGRFAARMRMNDDHNDIGRITPEYGGFLTFGPPDSDHSIGFYIPDAMFAEHPEWFSLINGKRYQGKGTASDSSQRCFSNMQMREFVKRKLREFIDLGERRAAAAGVPKPRVYAITQNDGSRFCECTECQAIVKRESALSGVIIDFINDIARDIAAERSDITLATLAYNKTEAPPRSLKVEPNVMIILTNMRSNTVFPIDAVNNPSFYQLLTGWSKIASNIRVWDYNINYREYNELAYPSEFIYQSNLNLYRQNNVTQSFAEFESPMHSDVREYKIYLWLKLLENPDQDFDALRKKFAAGYYGKAGGLFLTYRDLLRKSVGRTRPYIAFTPTPDNYLHLDLATMIEAQKIFVDGEKLLADDPVRLVRWQEAKLSLNRAALFRAKALKREYLQKYGNLNDYPFPNERLFAELREVWTRRLPLRPLKQSEEAARKQLEDDIVRYGRDYTPGSLLPPEKFTQAAVQGKIFDFTMENSSRFRNFAELVDDPESEAGFSARLAFPNRSPDTSLDKHSLPLVFGVHSANSGGRLLTAYVTEKMVPGAGYHWYRIGNSRLTPDALIFCFSSWLIQQSVGNAFDQQNPSAKYEIWIHMKLTGSNFPFAKPGDPDAIWIDRMALIKEKE